MKGLAWQAMHLALAAGLNTKVDARAKAQPYLDIANDVAFDELGGLQTRKPFAAFAAASPLNPRRFAPNGDELLMFSKDTLYSWNASTAAWIAKGTHLAVAMTEKTVFAATGDQITADRAELAGVIIHTWADMGRVWVAATDKVTGAVILSPTNPSIVGPSGSLPRVVALATRLMLVWVNVDGDLATIMIDPANVAASVATAWTVLVSSPTYSGSYDVTRVIGADQAVLACCSSPNTSYRLLTISAALAIVTHTVAQTASIVAVSSAPGGTHLVQVVRASGTNVFGELVDTSTMTLLATGQVIGNAASFLTQIACAHRSVQDGGQYRCYVFFPDGESTTANVLLKTAWADTSGAVGGPGTITRNIGCASRAFDYNGRVYLWAAYAMTSGVSFAGAAFRQTLQNGYFLLRDDGFLCAKATPQAAGGYPAVHGHLPGVASVDGLTYAWCGAVRRIIPLGASNNGSTGYAERSPRDISFTFDSNEARRCARLGGTLYIAAGELLQYDGSGLAEVGFHVYPARIAVTATTGAMDDGTYAWKFTYGYVNGAGERERSTDVTAATAVLSGGAGTNGGLLNVDNLYLTHKTAAVDSGRAPLIECWRTAKNPTDDAPFVKVSSDDPTLGAAPNNLIANDPSGFGITTGGGFAGEFIDELVDAAAILREPNPENGSVLEFVSPPAARIIIATADRLFLAGIADDPYEVWYSRTRNAGEIASFNDALTFTVPAHGGAITALAFLNETLVVLCEHGIYMLPGTGDDNTGGGQNFGPAQLISTDVGAVNHESVALTPTGLIFKSLKGWYMLGQGWQLQYIGDKVNAYDAETIAAVHVLESQHQIRCVSAERVLVLDYVAKQWAQWTIAAALDAVAWQGKYLYLTAAGAMLEQADFSGGVTYGIDIETAWIKLTDLQGFARVRRIMVLGAFLTGFKLRVRVARDYQSDGAGGWAYFDDKTWTPNDDTIGSALQLRHTPSKQQCESIKVRLTVVARDDEPLMESCKLTGLALLIGLKQPLYNRLPAAAKE